jgi:hypothetical protein
MSTAASVAETTRAARRPLELAGRVCTWLIVVQLAVSGVLLIARPEIVVTTVRHLGYPDYFSPMLGAAKLLAALAIAHPRAGVLAEWAYAGATFDVLAVVVSHAALRDPVGETLAPLAILAVIAASYVAFRERREER